MDFAFWTGAFFMASIVAVLEQIEGRRKKKAARAISPPPPCLNYIAGVVLPAPHDPRWRRHDNGIYRFGDEIEVRGSGQVYMRMSAADATIKGKLTVSAEEAKNYYTAIVTAEADFAAQLVAQRAAAVVLGPTLADDAWKALEQRFPDPDVPRRIELP